MTEPDIETMNQPGLARRLRRCVLATRPAFFTASILPVLAGTAWGYSSSGAFDGVAFVMALGATVLVHGGINVLNDVCDDTGPNGDGGTDRVNNGHIFPFTSGSRFIQNGIMSRAQMARLAGVLITLAVMAGLLLATLKGWPVVALGAGAIALGVLYSLPPVMLAKRGVGEIAVGIGFGPVPVMGAAWLQSGTWDSGGAILSLIIGIWIMMVLLINEVPDAQTDDETGKRTLVVRIGVAKTAVLYFYLNIAVAALVMTMIYFGWISSFAIMLPVLFLGLTQRAAHAILNSAGEPPSEHIVPMKDAIKTTLTVHALGTLWIAGWVLGNP